MEQGVWRRELPKNPTQPQEAPVDEPAALAVASDAAPVSAATDRKAAPILVSRDKFGHKIRPRPRRRVSFEERNTLANQDLPDNGQPGLPFPRPSLLPFLVIIVLAFSVGVLLYFFQPFMAPEDAPGKHIPANTKKPLIFTYETNDSAEFSTHADMNAFAGESSTSPASRGHRSAATKPPAALRSVNREEVCLANGSTWWPDAYPERPVNIVSRGGRSCGIVLYCCYTVNRDMEVTRPRSAPIACAASESSLAHPTVFEILLGLRGDDDVFERLINDGNETSRFAAHVYRFMRNTTCSGIRLWWPAATSFNSTQLVSLLAAIVAELREQSNLSLGLFLPYSRSQDNDYTGMLTSLITVLGTSRSILFYPTMSMFNGTAGWPQPADIAFPGMVTHQRDVRSAVCYIAVPQVVAVTLNETCNPHKRHRRQFILNATVMFHHDKGREPDSSWKTTKHRYYSYTCKDFRGLLIQSAAQATRFLADLRNLTRSSCFGIVEPKHEQ